MQCRCVGRITCPEMYPERIFRLKEVLDKLITPVIEEMGLELYDMELVKEGGTRILRLYIDKEGGVNLGDCENASRAVEVVLDEHDPIPTSYRLQVGSPGVERKLTKPEHFTRHIGHLVTVKLFAPFIVSDTISQKTFIGVLIGYDKENISLTDSSGKTYCFKIAHMSSCRLRVFDDESLGLLRNDKKRRTRDNG